MRSEHASQTNRQQNPMRKLSSWLNERFELSRQQNAQVYRKPMEGLRGFAMTLVFLVHYVNLTWPSLDQSSMVALVADGLQAIGRSGVDLFFLFSGFLVYGSLIKQPRPYPQLVKRRVRRIYPTFTVVFIAYVALSWLFPEQNRIPPDWKDAAVYLLENYLLMPGMFDIEPMITVAWSLSYDTFFFLTIPLVIGVLGLRRRTPAFRLTLFLTFTVIAVGYIGIYGGRIRMLMFIAGVVLYELMQLTRAKQTRIPAWWAPTALLSVLIALWSIHHVRQAYPDAASIASLLKVPCLFVGFNLMCLSCFSNPNSRFSRLFSALPLRWLGNMSYSYFLVHGLGLKATAMVLDKAWPGGIDPNGIGFFLLLPIMYLATLLAGAALFLCVERPFSLSRRNPPPAQPV